MQTETSIVIRTLNEGRHLERLLKGIQQQSYRDWEVVLVDSGSSDATIEIAGRYGVRIYHISPKEFTFGRSLNLGCQHARGRYLVFVSGHTYPPNNTWLSNLIRPFEEASVGMVYGRQRGMETNRLSEERDLERMFGTASKILINEPYGHNGNAAVRRDLWAGQSFDESLPGLEDLEWARRIQQRGFRVYYAGDAAICHVHQESLKQVYGRFFREGVAYRRIFPGYRFDKSDLVKGILSNVAGDFLYGIRQRKPVKKMLQIPSTRVAQFLGLWRGLNNHKKTTRELLLKLYYPDFSQSVVIEAAGRHSLKETKVPKIGPGEVLIQVAYVGVCATDLEVAGGRLEYYRTGYARYPVVPGHEYSGMVVEVGAEVRGLRKGDKAVGECAMGCGHCPSCAKMEFYRCPARKEVGVINMDGAYSRFLKLPAQYVHKLPREVALKEAALIEPLAVCLKGLRKLSVRPGLAACVIGAGPLGNFCAQVLKQQGAEVTAVDRDEKRLAMLHKYDMNVRTQLEPLDAFDNLVDATGSEEVIPQLIEKSKPSAKILLLGLPYTRPVPVSFSTVPCYDKEIIGSIASERRDWQEAIQLVRKRLINLSDHTAEVLPLESYEAAWKATETRSSFKVLLATNGDLGGL